MRRLTQIFLIKVKELSKRILLYLYWFPGFYRWSFLFSGTRRVVGRGKMQRGSARHSWVPGLSWGRFSNLFPCLFYCLLCNGFVECPVRLKKTHQIQLQRWCRSARSTSANMDTMFASDVAGILSYRAVLNAGYKCSYQTFCDIMLPLLSKSSTCSGFVPYITVRT